MKIKALNESSLASYKKLIRSKLDAILKKSFKKSDYKITIHSEPIDKFLVIVIDTKVSANDFYKIKRDLDRVISRWSFSGFDYVRGSWEAEVSLQGY